MYPTLPQLEAAGIHQQEVLELVSPLTQHLNEYLVSNYCSALINHLNQEILLADLL